MDYFQEFVPKQLVVRAELRYLEVKSAEQTLLTVEKMQIVWLKYVTWHVKYIQRGWVYVVLEFKVKV